SGINRQIFNTPIDLFIEDFLYKKFPELRPYQFISLNNLIREGSKAVTDKKIVELSPKEILSKSKIYNLISALQFRDLCGVDLIPEFKANNSELKTAQKLYNEFAELKDKRQPGEEYDLVQKWADVLKLSDNFELVSETEYRNRTDTGIMLDSISKDPFELKNEDPEKIKETEKFLKSQKSMGTNMAVIMYMTEALRYFENMEKISIRDIAFEIALLGAHGLHPDRKYKLNSISGKEFSGYQILAYYYVSWKLAIPEKLAELKLPYDNEYELAEKLFKNDAR
ncbi:MAG: hypothetical protein KDD00_16870, partial [Ignavibacteriae bacterium]|nr:hypothetical protein [Ignavibacteriota bacterium]